MKKIRKKQGYLEGFQKQNRTISIGVIGAVSGSGVTTMAIAMANYLAGILRKKVAVYEHNSKRAFAQMCEYYGTIDIMKHQGCIYYSKSSTQLSNLYNDGFDIVIIDFGSEKANISEFMRCTYRVVMSSMEPWKMNMCNEFYNIVSEVNGSETWLWIINGDSKTLRKYMKSTGMHILKRPFIDNCFVVDNSMVEFLEALF